MCYDKYYSILIREDVHIQEICIRCARKLPACLMNNSNGVLDGMCPLCVKFMRVLFPEAFADLK